MICLNSSHLSAACEIARRAISGRSTLPILSHLYLYADPKSGAFGIHASDLEIWISAGVKPQDSNEAMFDASAEFAQVFPTGVCLSAATFGSLVGRLRKNEQLKLNQDASNKKVQIRCVGVNSSFPYLPGDDFPTMPEMSDGGAPAATLTIPAKQLIRLFSHTEFTADHDKDSTRQINTGVYVSFDADRSILTLASTNTHHLSRCRWTMPPDSIQANSEDAKCIIPIRAISEVIGLASKAETITMSIAANGSNVRFSWLADANSGLDGPVILQSRCIEGVFPNYERVIPASADKEGIIAKSDLITGLGRVMIAGADNANRVILDFDQGGHDLVMNSESGSVGRIEDRMEVGWSGSGIVMAANGKYLQAALNTFDKSDGIRIKMTEPLRPFTITPVAALEEYGFDYLYLCMPMQVI